MVDFSLNAHPSIPVAEKPVLVCIIDGYGENKYTDKYNAVVSAETPCIDALRSKAPDRWCEVQAHGTAVGLPSDADMGNSEVGHNALGSGQVVDQGARLVDIALETGEMFTGDGWKYISAAFENNTLHFIGLLSDGGVHSRFNQLIGTMKGAAEKGAKKMRCHVLSDGRDVPDGSFIGFVEALEKDLTEINDKFGCDAKIASGGGRMHVTMDRYEADWAIVERGWKTHVLGESPNKFKSAVDAAKTLRGSGEGIVSDQFLDSFVIVDDSGAPVGTVQDEDAVVLFNFRADRMVEISKAFEYEDFNAFDRVRYPKNLKFVGMMQYDGDLKLPANFLVPPPVINGVSGQYLVKNGISTFACSETQKFGHVTFFWNGNRSGYFDETLETYIEIPSDAGITFDKKPEMKAREITEAAKEAILSNKYKMIRINYANPDMVGHTGNLKASIEACAFVDGCVKELLDLMDEIGGRWLVTSDHGNSDDMVQRQKKTGEPMFDAEGNYLPLTSHTLNPVGVAIGGAGLPDSVKFKKQLDKAGLANITATYINLLGYQAPSHFQPSLLDE
eukprot:TRINITY_DN3286_c0_g1_i5.p1 TRINITY_DN3286_c0_g1~~TRINITY_DN3286_c0_g1_i5.p1  ORF type:complete len:560 (+),score=123.28 TRINITY_DN3286_c0_g1_i5:81-1760(+)